ncbi:DUF6306 domain-containing protein [Phenylobacterium sp.]|uniref:DUF6306 domain-containing protein n=1 Tax=Phenylobacterium sp. TaxID=1871053 RepID=UPI0025F8253D|nr:DUF6306 domain-containing protein [Phenylobacterium sp.]
MSADDRIRPPAASPRYAAEVDPGDMGNLTPAELVEQLNMLLEAERAGVRVAAALVGEAPNPDLKLTAFQLRRDEAHWCHVLSEALIRMGEKPSAKVGDFYHKAMAIPGFEARLAFVNRGQGWVVRKLRALLPRVADAGLHSELRAMLDGHAENIAFAERALRRAGGAPGSGSALANRSAP